MKLEINYKKKTETFHKYVKIKQNATEQTNGSMTKSKEK